MIRITNCKIATPVSQINLQLSQTEDQVQLNSITVCNKSTFCVSRVKSSVWKSPGGYAMDEYFIGEVWTRPHTHKTSRNCVDFLVVKDSSCGQSLILFWIIQ